MLLLYHMRGILWSRTLLLVTYPHGPTMAPVEVSRLLRGSVDSKQMAVTWRDKGMKLIKLLMDLHTM